VAGRLKKGGDAAARPRHQARLPRFIADEPVGLGDVAKRVISAVGVKPCSACGERAARLNQWLQFGPRI
jgi:hypothetical protein